MGADARRLYSEALAALEEHARKGGTAIGFGAVLKKVALGLGLDVQNVPVPRLARSVYNPSQPAGKTRLGGVAAITKRTGYVPKPWVDGRDGPIDEGA